MSQYSGLSRTHVILTQRIASLVSHQNACLMSPQRSNPCNCWNHVGFLKKPPRGSSFDSWTWTPERLRQSTEVCTSMITVVAWFIVTKTWNQPRSPWGWGEQIKNRWCIYAMGFYFSHRKNKDDTFKKVDKTVSYHIKWNKTKPER